MRQLRQAWHAWRANRPVRYRRQTPTHWAVARKHRQHSDLVGINTAGTVVCRSCLAPWDHGHQCDFPND